MNRFVIVDGNAILHRAYHALPYLTGRAGIPTNAVYGFASILLKLVNDFKPSSLAVCFDRPEPTFRKEVFKDYQAKRPEMEDNLVNQVDIVKKMIDDLGIKRLEKAGYEADDLIGSLVFQAKSDKAVEEVIIVTGDRDLLQLVDEKTKVFMPVTGISTGKIYDGKEVRVKMGVGPEKVTALKALTGDSSDNYPGVAGIGPKTATHLLNKYETLDNIFTAVVETPEQFSPKVKNALTEGKKDAYFFLKIAAIVCDVPLELDASECSYQFNADKFSGVLSDLGFKTLAKRALGNQKNKKTREQENKKEQRQNNKSEQLSLV